jgi:CubicO group peptidase (beta-lactamase class C family)
MSTADALREFLEARIAGGSMPGATWWVEDSQGVLASGAAGLAVGEPEPEPARESTPYDLASVTKPLATALLAVLLEQDGLLRLGDPLSRHLPESRGTPWNGASLEDLARHRAGLVAWRPLYLAASDREGVVRAILSEPSGGAGGDVLYSDLGYLLLGFVLERASGRRLDRLLVERVTGPLGRSESLGYSSPGRFDAAAAVERGNRYERTLAGPAGERFAWRTRIPRGQVHDGNAHALGGVAGHAGLFGSAEAVAAVGREILRPSVIPLGNEARRRLLDTGPSGRSVGFEAAASSGAAREVLPDGAPGHTGFTGTSIWLEPGRGRAYVLLTNRVHPEVPEADFQPVRREFHRLAAAIPDRR